MDGRSDVLSKSSHCFFNHAKVKVLLLLYSSDESVRFGRNAMRQERLGLKTFNRSPS